MGIDWDVRQLTPADAAEIFHLVTFNGLTLPRLVTELAAGDDYRWVGLATSAGDLCAVHRSMRWGRHLMLKGVFVAESARGSGAALRLAFALRDIARAEGFAGIAAWIERGKPEAGLAHMLRLRETGPALHRFEMPLPWAGDGRGAEMVGGASVNAGTVLAMTIGFPPGSWLVPDLFGIAQCPGAKTAGRRGNLAVNRADTLVNWMVDGRRLVLSCYPASSVAELDRLATAMGEVTGARDADMLEFPLPAGDLWAALSLTRTGARRLSRTPVRLGRRDFGELQTVGEVSGPGRAAAVAGNGRFDPW